MCATFPLSNAVSIHLCIVLNGCRVLVARMRRRSHPSAALCVGPMMPTMSMFGTTFLSGTDVRIRPVEDDVLRHVVWGQTVGIYVGRLVPWRRSVTMHNVCVSSIPCKHSGRYSLTHTLLRIVSQAQPGTQSCHILLLWKYRSRCW